MSVTVRAVPCLLCFFDIFVYESKRVDVVKVSDEKRSVKASVNAATRRDTIGPRGKTLTTAEDHKTVKQVNETGDDG